MSAVISHQLKPRPDSPGPEATYGVEICWIEGDDVACRALQVVARSNEEAAQRALAEVDRPTAEVVDVQPHFASPALGRMSS